MMTVADIARAVRRGAAISIMLVCVAILPAVPAQAPSGHHWRTLTIHQAWTVTVTGARRVAKQAESLQHTYGPSRPNSVEVQPQSSSCCSTSPSGTQYASANRVHVVFWRYS